MKILTAYPIYVNRKRESYSDYYLNIDANNKAQVKQFQEWVIANKGVNLDYISASTKQWVKYPASVDGDFSTKGKTYKAYKKYGAEWEKSIINAPTNTTTTDTKPETVVVNDAPKVPTGSDPTSTQVEEQKKKGVFWDKAKGVWVKAKDSGMIDKLANWLGVNTGVQTDTNPVVDTNAPPIKTPEEIEKEKKKKRIIMISVIGGVVLLGVIIFIATRPKGNK